MSKNNASSLRVNISRIFTVLLAVDDLFEAVQNLNPDADVALLKNVIAQIKWIAAEIEKIRNFMDYILDGHPDHRLSPLLRSDFKNLPQQLDKIQTDAIRANLNLIGGGEVKDDLNVLQIGLYDLRNVVHRSYTSLSGLYTSIETT